MNTQTFLFFSNSIFEKYFLASLFSMMFWANIQIELKPEDVTTNYYYCRQMLKACRRNKRL